MRILIPLASLIRDRRVDDTHVSIEGCRASAGSNAALFNFHALFQ